MSEAPVRRTVHFTGQVQGVGFRYTTQRVSEQHDVTGTVKNLPDGRVELVAEGEPSAVSAFVQAVSNRMEPNIADVQTSESTATGEFNGFHVVA